MSMAVLSAAIGLVSWLGQFPFRFAVNRCKYGKGKCGIRYLILFKLGAAPSFLDG